MSIYLKRVSTLVLLLSLYSYKAECQDTLHLHLPGYANKQFHFGYFLAINSADFVIKNSSNIPKNDSLQSVKTFPQAGFDLGLVSELKLTPCLRLRFTPSISFADRQLTYNFSKSSVVLNSQSTLLNFPLDIKLQSKRWKNLSGYLIAGMKYTYDIPPSNHDTSGVIGLKRNDLYYEGGGGIDFYLPYFKFAIEFKFSQGLENLLIPNNTIYAQPLQGLYSRIYLISFTFEG